MDFVNSLVRKNVLNLTPYSSARDEYSGEEGILLDANENPYKSQVNRYPDPLQRKLKLKIWQIKGVRIENIFLGNGSDEPIDLFIRAFCEPGIDNIISIKPTYGMYRVCADINGVEFREVLLTPSLQIDKKTLLEASDSRSKLLFLCSPNNPTSNSFRRDDILFIIENFKGIVILDEAYIDFSVENSLLPALTEFHNLVILQTLSKAWGMAGIRLGMAFASAQIIQILNRIKYPYNVNSLSQEFALNRLSKEEDKVQWVKMILEQRKKLSLKLMENKLVEEILPSDANFLMVRFKNPKQIFRYLTGEKIIVRDRSAVPLCEGCLRFTIGTDKENEALLKALQDYNM